MLGCNASLPKRQNGHNDPKGTLSVQHQIRQILCYWLIILVKIALRSSGERELT